MTHTYINLGLLWRGPVKHLNIRGWLQVEAIDQTLGAILTDLGDVYDAFMILWWRVLSGACTRGDVSNAPVSLTTWTAPTLTRRLRDRSLGEHARPQTLGAP